MENKGFLRDPEADTNFEESQRADRTRILGEQVVEATYVSPSESLPTTDATVATQGSSGIIRDGSGGKTIF